MIVEVNRINKHTSYDVTITLTEDEVSQLEGGLCPDVDATLIVGIVDSIRGSERG